MRIDKDGVFHFDGGGSPDEAYWDSLANGQYVGDVWTIGDYVNSPIEQMPPTPWTPNHTGGNVPVFIGTGGSHNLPGDSGGLNPGEADYATEDQVLAQLQQIWGADQGQQVYNNLTPAPAAPTPPAGVSDADILEFLSTPKTDAEIAAAMAEFGVDASRVANLTGVSEAEVAARQAAAQNPAPSAPETPSPPEQGGIDLPNPIAAVGGYVSDALAGMWDWLKNTAGAVVLNPRTGQVVGTWGGGGTAPYMPVGGKIPGTHTQPGIMTGNAVIDKVLQVLKGGANVNDIPNIIDVIIAEEMGIDTEAAKVIREGAGDIVGDIEEVMGGANPDEEGGTDVIIDPTGGSSGGGSGEPTDEEATPGTGGTGTPGGTGGEAGVPGEVTVPGEGYPGEVVIPGEEPPDEVAVPGEEDDYDVVPGGGDTGGGGGNGGDGGNGNTPPGEEDDDQVVPGEQQPGGGGGGAGGWGGLLGMLGGRGKVTTPEVANIPYQYDFDSIFATPQQAAKFITPAGVSRLEDYEILQQLAGETGMSLEQLLEELHRGMA